MSDRWEMSGTILIACNCDYGCPCNFNAPPTYGDCEGGWIWHVETGHYGQVDLGGARFSLFADWPGAIHEGGGRAVAYFDERLEENQRAALEELLCGRAGGPWGIFVNTYELDGPHPLPHDIELDADRSVARVGEVAELRTEPIRNPVTGAEVSSTVLLPSGLVAQRAAMLSSAVFRVDDGVAYDHSGKYAAAGDFRYAGP